MLEPTFVDSLAGLQKLAEEMKKYAREKPLTEEPPYSKTLEEAVERARSPEMVEYCKHDANVRLVIFRRTFPVTLGFTLDQYKNPPQWTLSMSLPQGLDENNQPRMGRVPDTLANVIATAFFGEGYDEVPPAGAFKTVRQFQKVV